MWSTWQMPVCSLSAAANSRKVSRIRRTMKKELAELIEEVPLDSIHFHTHSYFLRHGLIEGTYPNDFAQWSSCKSGITCWASVLRSLIRSTTPDLENLREELISIIRRPPSRSPIIPRVVFGQPFHFKRSRIPKSPSVSRRTRCRSFATL